MNRLWRVLEWGFTMTLLCWVFVRMWTDTGFTRRGRPRLVDRFRRRLPEGHATDATLPAAPRRRTRAAEVMREVER